MQALQDLYQMAEEYWTAQPAPQVKSIDELMNDLASAMTDLMREMKTEPGALSSLDKEPMAVAIQNRYPNGVELDSGIVTFHVVRTQTPNQSAKYNHLRPNEQELVADGTRVTVTGVHRGWQFVRVGVHGYLSYRYDRKRVVNLLPVDSRTLPDAFISDISLAINHVLDATDVLATMADGSSYQ